MPQQLRPQPSAGGHNTRAATRLRLSGPVMIVMSGGNPYIVDNMTDKMPDGSRMIDYFDKRTYGNF